MFKLEVTADELNILGHALSALPFKDVAVLMSKLQYAYDESLKGAAENGYSSPSTSTSEV